MLVAAAVATVRDRFRLALEEAGHQVMVVRTAAEALAHVRNAPGPIDLLVLDLHLPDASSLDVVRHVHELGRGKLTITLFGGTVHTIAEARQLAALNIAGYVDERMTRSHILPALARWLCPEQCCRRVSPRVPLTRDVEFQHGQTRIAGITVNVSRGGLAVHTDFPLLTGTTQLRFSLDPSTSFVIDARVTWSRRHDGMGLAFAQPSPDLRDAVDRYVSMPVWSRTRALSDA